MNKVSKSGLQKLLVSLFLIVLLNISLLSPFSFNFKNLFSLPASSNQSFLADAQIIQTTVFCSNGMALCTSGLAASCVDPNYTPTCFGDSNFQPIECCRSSGISLSCRPDITFICSGSTTSGSSTSTSTTSSSTSSGNTVIPLCSTGTYCSNGFVPDCSSDEDFKCIDPFMNIPVCINKITFDKRTPNCIIPLCTSSGSFCMPGLVPDCAFPERFKCIGGVGDLPCCFDGTNDTCRVPNCVEPTCMSNGTFCDGGFIPDCTGGETFECVNSMPYCIMNGSPVGDARTPNCIQPSCNTSGTYCSSGLVPDCNVNEPFLCINNTPYCHDEITHTTRIPSCVATSSGSSSSSSTSSSSSSSSSSGSSSSSSSSSGSTSSSSSGSSTSSSSGSSSSSSSSGQIVTSANLVLHLNANNLDGMGNFADNTDASVQWTDLTSSINNGILSSFTLPTNGVSGWNGTNTMCSPSNLKFDGTNDFVDAGLNPSLQIPGALTLEAWVNPNGIPSGADSGIAGTGINNYQLTYHNNGSIFFYVNSGSNNIQAPSVSPNIWHHVVGTWDGTTNLNGIKLYVDGLLSAQGTSTESSISGWNNFIVGNETTQFNGQIAKVRVYDTDLDPSQVQQNYLAEQGEFPNNSCPMSLVSPSSALNKQDKFSAVNIEVVSSPQLPKIFKLPVLSSDLDGKVGSAINGSNPSFEIKLPNSIDPRDVVSVELKDLTSGNIYNRLHFSISAVPGEDDRYILNISLPNIPSSGETRFALNLNNGAFFTGALYIFNPPSKVRALKGNSPKQISKPAISRVVVNRNNQAVTLQVKGENFVGKAFLFGDKNSTKFVVSPENLSNTTVTILPLSLNAQVKGTTVSQSGNIIKINLTVSGELSDVTDAVLILSTPLGTDSKQFVIK